MASHICAGENSLVGIVECQFGEFTAEEFIGGYEKVFFDGSERGIGHGGL